MAAVERMRLGGKCGALFVLTKSTKHELARQLATIKQAHVAALHVRFCCDFCLVHASTFRRAHACLGWFAQRCSCVARHMLRGSFDKAVEQALVASCTVLIYKIRSCLKAVALHPLRPAIDSS